LKKNQESGSIIANLIEQSKKNESHVHVEENVDAAKSSDSSE